MMKKKVTAQKAQLTDNAKRVLSLRYLKRNDTGEVIEEPEDMFYRVASNIASKEVDSDKWTEIFYSMMANMEFLPNSPTLMNAGRDIQQLAACFVLPVGDSMAEIFDAVKNTALIHKSGGGTGFSFSRLRPSNDKVKTTKGVSSGPISFMRVFDIATETVKQGGTRRGANMGLLRCDHPDILEFISIKEKDGVLSNFNISVGITDAFMKALKSDKEYNLVNPKDGSVTSTLKASDVWNKIIKCAWKNGEPGIVFLDSMNKDNPTPHIGIIESTNPCGEQPLLPFESCNLGSINIIKVLDEKNQIDWDKFEMIIRNSVRFLDNVIDLNNYPLPEIANMTKGNRKIGLGLMGFSDALIKMKIAYNSEDALEVAKQVMSFIQDIGRDESRKLAKERGVFPNFKGSIYEGDMEVRNATITTIAPTGTLSMIASCSSGIEPIFSLVYEKNVLDGRKFLEVHPDFLRVAKEAGFYSEELMETIMKTGSVVGIKEIPEWVQKVFVTSHDISPETHVAMQASFQRYTDNAVSKTINFPHNATIKDVEDSYKKAYEAGCKGITVYRDGSREHQVMTIGSTNTNKPNKIAKDIKMPNVFNNGQTMVIKKEGKKFYIHFSYMPDDEKQEYPVILWIYTNAKYKADELKICNVAAKNLYKLAIDCGLNKKWVDETFEKANQDYPHNRLGRMVSLCLRHNIPREDIIVALSNIDEDHISTLVTAIRKFLSKTLADGTTLKGEKCPECGANVVLQEGCKKCEASCGWAAC